jgi:hypothetical protein
MSESQSSLSIAKNDLLKVNMTVLCRSEKHRARTVPLVPEAQVLP